MHFKLGRPIDAWLLTDDCFFAGGPKRMTYSRDRDDLGGEPRNLLWCGVQLGRRPAVARASRAAIVAASRRTSAVATFSSRGFRLEVPGINRMCGSWARSQARPTWAGVAPWVAAAASTAGGPGPFAVAPEARATGQ